MPVAIKDRPMESVRDEVIDQLIVNYSHGKLSYEAFEARLDKAMESKNNEEIAALAEDLDIVVDQQYLNNKARDFGPYVKPNASLEADRMVNIFGGSNRSGHWKVPREMSTLTVCGGADIDFSDAEFTSEEVTIKVFCLFGGDNIYVPEGVNVVTKAFCIFGGIDNKTVSVRSINGPTIIIEGIVLFGGIDIKIKRTIKEKFVAFADSMKRMFN